MKLVLIIFIGIMIQNNHFTDNHNCVINNSKIITSLTDTSLCNSFFPVFEIRNSDHSAVFKYQKKIDDLSGKSLEQFVFEVTDESHTSFQFKDEEIIETKALYIYKDDNRMLLEEKNFNIDNGYIKGDKLNNNTWGVSIDVEIWDSESGSKFRFILNERFIICDTKNL